MSFKGRLFNKWSNLIAIWKKKMGSYLHHILRISSKASIYLNVSNNKSMKTLEKSLERKFFVIWYEAISFNQDIKSTRNKAKRNFCMAEKVISLIHCQWQKGKNMSQTKLLISSIFKELQEIAKSSNSVGKKKWQRIKIVKKIQVFQWKDFQLHLVRETQVKTSYHFLPIRMSKNLIIELLERLWGTATAMHC